MCSFTVFKFTLVLMYPPPSPSIASQEKKSIKCLCCLLSYMSLHDSLGSWLGLHACVHHSNLSERVQCDLRANMTSLRFKTSRHLSHLHCGYNAYVLDMSGTSVMKNEIWFRSKKYTHEKQHSINQLWHRLINIASGTVVRPGEEGLGGFWAHWAPTH